MHEVFLFLKIAFVVAKSIDPDEMLQNVAFHLSKYRRIKNNFLLM